MDEQDSMFERRGLARLLLTSAITGGFVARAYAISMPKLSGGRPVSLSLAGEVTFFILGGLIAGMTAALLGASPVVSLELAKRHRVVTFGLGIGIGLLCGILTIPCLGMIFITLPAGVFEFLTE